MSWLYGVYSTVAFISKPSYITDKNCGHSIVVTQLWALCKIKTFLRSNFSLFG